MQWIQVRMRSLILPHPCPLTQILFASQSELSFEHCRLPSSSSSADKRQLHSSKHQRHQSRSEVVTFPLIHFDCALAPAAAGAFRFVAFQETDVVTPLFQARRSNSLCRYFFYLLCIFASLLFLCQNVDTRSSFSSHIISFYFLCVYHVALKQALLEPCEGELGCVLWDDAVRRSIPSPSCSGQHHIAGASFFALVSF